MKTCTFSEMLRGIGANGAAVDELQWREFESHLGACSSCQTQLNALTNDQEVIRWREALKVEESGQPTDLPSAQILQQLLANNPFGMPQSGDREPELPSSDKDEFSGRLGPYDIQHRLGAGGMGVVYLARDQLGRHVALKVLRSELAENERNLRRFRREAKRAASVEHDHVVRVYNFGGAPEHDLTFLAMEYIDGQTLLERLERLNQDGTRHEKYRESAEIVRQVATGLAALHANHIVHRDVKSANVLLERATGRAKITDFGLAISRDATGHQVSRAEHIAGTSEYLSPEQIAAPEAVDARSDIYGLGITLYEQLVGERPFRADTLPALYRQILQDEPVPPRKRNETIPRDLETITLKCLAREPNRRYQTAEALADDLGRYLDGRAISARPVGQVERARLWCRRNPRGAWIAAAITLVIIVGSSTIAGMWYRAEQQRQLADDSRAMVTSILRENLQLFASIEDDVESLDDPGSPRNAFDLLEDVLPPGISDPDDFEVSIAKSFASIGSQRFSLGDSEGAQGSIGESIRIYESLRARSPNEVEYTRLLAGAVNNLGIYLLATDVSGGIEQFERAQLLLESLRRDRPRDFLVALELSGLYSNMGMVLDDQGKSDRGLELKQSAVRVLEELALAEGAVEQSPNTVLQYSKLLANLAVSILERDRPEEARAQFQKALGSAEKLVAAYPSNEASEFQLALCRFGIAKCDKMQDDSESATLDFESCREVFDRFHSENPLVPIYARVSVEVRLDQAELMASQGDVAESQAIVAIALEKVRRHLTRWPADKKLREHKEKALNMQDND